jgi:hypothetical protein
MLAPENNQKIMEKDMKTALLLTTIVTETMAIFKLSNMRVLEKYGPV